MTAFSDVMRLGNAGGLGDSRVNPETYLPFQGGGVQGVKISPIYMYSVVPVTGTLAALQTLTSANFTLSAAGGITATSINGTTYYDLGCARTLVFTGGATPQTAIVMVVSGKDDYLQNLTQTLTGPTGTGTAETLKTFRYVAGIFASGNTTSTVSVAVGDKLGLPYCVTSVDFVQFSWAGTKVTASTSFSGAVTTSPSTAALGDVRGVYGVSSASDGVKRFTAQIYVNDPNSVTGAYGVAQV
jgi:hypothetical protein